MSISCNDNGTICIKSVSGRPKTSDTLISFIIGSIACFIFIIVLIFILYILCCKRYIRKKPRVSFQSSTNQEQINSVVTEEVSQYHRRRLSNEQPPSYQEANINRNTNFS